MSRLVRTMLAVAAAIAIATPALAATVSNMSVSPSALSISEGGSGTYSVAVAAISGNIPARTNTPLISYCSDWTIHSDSTLTCNQTLTIELQRDRNYSQVPLTAAEILALTRTVTVNVDSGLCGQSFSIDVVATLNSGSGTDFPGGVSSYEWGSVGVTVTCETQGGCGHGYWKNHLSAWQTYTPGTVLGSVFTMSATYSSISSDTFGQALDFDGGPTLVDKAKLLMLQAVAAALNAEQPLIYYPLTTSEVITQVNAALASGDQDQILALQGTLDGYNNLGSAFCGDDE